MATCKQCGKDFVYDDDVGYALDLCGPFCDGVHSQRAKLYKKDAEIERLRYALNRLHDVAVSANIWLFTGDGDRATVACGLNRVLIELSEAKPRDQP